MFISNFMSINLRPKKTLSNGLFLSKAAGFINPMTTNLKKYVLKKNIHRYMYINTINIKLLHKPQSTQKKDTIMPWPANKKPKVLVHHTAYPRIPRPPPSSSAVVAASYGRRGVCPTAASWFPGAVAPRENGCYPWGGTRPWLLNLCHGALWKGKWYTVYPGNTH